jgi:pyruvate ferredoxin oxidoreductase gamma subunit
MKFQRDIIEIIFFARGGQGAKVAAEILTQAAVREGSFVQAFPSFGPERSGAPTKTFVRISYKPIRTHEIVVDPDVVVVLDETLLGDPEITKNLDDQETLIINSASLGQDLMGKLNGFRGKVQTIDANGISARIVGQPRPNTVILGKLIQVTELVKLESVTEEFRKIFESKIGKEETDKNILAIEKAYDEI